MEFQKKSFIIEKNKLFILQLRKEKQHFTKIKILLKGQFLHKKIWDAKL